MLKKTRFTPNKRIASGLLTRRPFLLGMRLGLAIFRLVNGKIQTQFEKTVVNLATIASSCIFWDQICALEISALNSSLLG